MFARAIPMLVFALMLAACNRLDHPPPPPEWLDTVKVKGQVLPVPKAWIASEEGNIAHSLIPPAVSSKMVPFDFSKATWQSILPFGDDLSTRYWKHLCETEADEWIVKTAEGVEGFYFARPVPKATWPEELTDLYFFEAPTINTFYYSWDVSADRDSLHKRGAVFVAPVFVSYTFVEEPRRNAPWQQNIVEPYIRMFGHRYDAYENEWSLNERGEKHHKRIMGTPMHVIGISEPTAQYAYTWRGLKRERDRELGVSGIEYIIYDRISKQVLSLRRTFLLAASNPAHTTRRAWLQGTHCSQAAVLSSGNERISYQPLRTLKTKEPSSTILYELTKDKK